MNKFNLILLLSVLSCSSVAVAGGGLKPEGGRGPKFLNMFDANGDGSVTEAEFQNGMQQRYQNMDQDKNGIVSVDEFKQSTDKRHKRWEQQKANEMDLGGNKTVSKQEFIDRAVKRAEKRFARMDKNNDGVLDQDERASFHKNKKQQLMNRMDSNGDGQISVEEHQNMAKRWFEKLDADNNKVVTGDELKQARPHFR